MPSADTMLKIARMNEQTGGGNRGFGRDRPSPSSILASLKFERLVRGQPVRRHTHYVEDREAGEFKFVVK